MENENQYFRLRSAQWCSRASLALLALALASGMVLGSGVSQLARMVLELCASLALVATLGEMVFAGQWRVTRSKLWFIPLALVALPLAQLGLAKVGMSFSQTAPWRGEQVVNGIPAPGAAAESAYLLVACFVLFAVATAQVRSPARLGVVAGALAIILAALGVMGPTVSNRGAAKWFGLGEVSLGELSLSPRVLLAAAPLGMAGYQPWLPAADTSGADELAWFAPRGNTAPPPLFPGFWSLPHWGACVVALIPVLLLLAVRLAWRASRQTGSAWYKDAKGQLAILAWGAATTLAVLATLRLPLVSFAALSLGLGGAILLSPGVLRRPVVFAAGGCLAATAIAFLAAAVRSGASGMVAFLQQSWRDDASLARVFWDHLLMGCGLGGGGDVWHWYRVDSADVAWEGSSLLALLAESGLAGVGILALTAVLVTQALREARGGLESDPGIVVIGLMGGLVGLLTAGIFGPGIEAPVALALGLVLLGVLARGLANMPKGVSAA